MKSCSLVTAVVILLCQINLSFSNPLRQARDEIQCRKAQLTDQQCVQLDDGDALKLTGCFDDAYYNEWKSCSVICEARRITGSTSLRMKCRDYCPWYFETQCYLVAPDVRTDSQKIGKLEEDMNQVLLNQRNQRRVLLQIKEYLVKLNNSSSVVNSLDKLNIDSQPTTQATLQINQQ